MTPLNRNVKRESVAAVFSRGRSRPVVIHLLSPGHLIGFRLKGERTLHTLPVDYLYKLAVKATVLDRKREKAEARKAKRNAHA